MSAKGTVIAASPIVKLAAIALDYDGTIALHGAMEPAVRTAIGEARAKGIAVVLATGRRLQDLRRVAGDFGCFDVIVAENGAVLDFPSSGRHVVIGHPAPAAFVDALRQRGVACDVGESLVEASAGDSMTIVDVIHAMEQPLVLTFNRGRVMALPQAVGKSTGLRQALLALRISMHNTIAIGDAENDHDLLDACEVGVAVEWGSRVLLSVADEVVRGTGPADVARYLRSVASADGLTAEQMGRRRLTLGRQHDGTPVDLAIRGRAVLIAGEPGTGKSWLAGLMAEQLILQGYCVCIIDPEGDYVSLEALPGVIVLGGDDPPPGPRELTRALRHPDVSVVVDLSKVRHREKLQYMATLLDLLVRLRRQSGLPHRIVIDEAHYLIGQKGGIGLASADLEGLTLVTYRVSTLAGAIRLPANAVTLVTRETDRREAEALRGLCRDDGATRSGGLFADLRINEAAMLPGPAESLGCARRFEIGPRMTTHVRHRTKYLDMPVNDPQAFVFSSPDGRPVTRARTLKEFVGLLAALPPDVIGGHVRRHDFSRWVEDVFRDGPLAARMRTLEARLGIEQPADVAAEIDQAIRARYERIRSDVVTAQPA